MWKSLLVTIKSLQCNYTATEDSSDKKKGREKKSLTLFHKSGHVATFKNSNGMVGINKVLAWSGQEIKRQMMTVLTPRWNILKVSKSYIRWP